MHQIYFTVVTALLLSSCSLDHATAAPTAGVIARWSGAQGGTAEASTRLIRSAGEWSAFWAQVGSEPTQRFDPDRTLAVAVFLGERRTGGFSVEITEARDSTEGLDILFRENGPKRDERVAQMLTSPWTLVLIPATSRPVTVKKVPVRPADR